MTGKANCDKDEKTTDEEVLIGPALNDSKAPLDKKEYRQILLPNGLRALLVSDVAAMNQIQSEGGMFLDDDEDDDEEEDEEAEKEDGPKVKKHPKVQDGDDEDDESDDDDDGEPSFLRDAAVALSVGVGSFADPPECQGLAHFLEHLLFMGSEKYPEENDYDAFMSKHGGENNAWTELEETVYHFSIPQEYLRGALDRLANFFIAPLMLKSGVERELNAIESEFQLNKQSDHCRLHQLWGATSGKPDHPCAKFSWGNIKSLKEIPEQRNVDPMVKLREFFDKYYYAANMRLVIVGAYTLDDLQDIVVKHLSAVPALPRDGSMHGQKVNTSWDNLCETPKHNLPFVEGSLNLYRVIPVKDRHNLSITWMLPPQASRWRTKPCDYIAHLMGHEAQGSLLSALKKKQWVTTCVAGGGGSGMESASTHSLFSMTFTLSVEGVDHWPSIVAAVYSYIGMLRHYGNNLPEWIYHELRSLNEFAYRYADEPSPEDFVEDVIEDMRPYLNVPPARLLDGGHLLFEDNPQEIQDLLLHFTPQNARIDFFSTTFGRAADFDAVDDFSEPREVLQPSVKFDKTKAGPPNKEPWFGAYYWIEDLDPDMVKQWKDLGSPQMPTEESMLSLPPKNPFVPTKFDMKPTPPDDSDHPLLDCSLKLCVSLGKQKQWLPATVTKYDSTKNRILVSYEDEDEKWHKVDQDPDDVSRKVNSEGTLDGKKTKFKVVAVPKDGEGVVRKFGDDSDFDVLDGTQFPAIPPARAASRLPQLVRNTQALKLWHMQDRTFLRPIAELRVAVFSNRINENALHRACTELVVQLCADALTETVYMASLCELGSSIESSEVGFGFRINGFDDKLLQLFKVVFGRLLSFRGRTAQDGLPDGIEDARFSACVEMLQRKYQNSGMDSASLASSARVRCICPGSWSPEQKAEAIKDLQLPKFVEVAASVVQNLSIHALFHGNVDSSEAKAAANLIEGMLKDSVGSVLPKKKFYYQYVSQVPFVQTPILVTLPSKDLESGNTAVEVYFQVGKDNILDRVVMDMLIHLMEEPLYDQLRTKEQFGYRVSCDTRWTSGVMGMKFAVVTSTKSATATTERIDKFLEDFRKDLAEMKADDFMENLVALAKNKLEMFHSLAEETSNFWAEIRDCRYDWEVNRREALTLRGITKEMVLNGFDKWLNPSAKRRIIVVQVICAQQKDCDGTAATGRPQVQAQEVGKFCDDRVEEFHKLCKKQTWGKIFT